MSESTQLYEIKNIAINAVGKCEKRLAEAVSMLALVAQSTPITRLVYSGLTATASLYIPDLNVNCSLRLAGDPPNLEVTCNGPAESAIKQAIDSLANLLCPAQSDSSQPIRFIPAIKTG